MDDRRRELRRFPTTHFKLFDKAAGRSVGHIADFSEDGFMLISTQTMQADIENDFYVHVPIYHHAPSESKSLPSDRNIEFRAVSLWCRPDTLAADLFDIGFRFTKITKDDAAFLVRSHGFLSE